ncbi:MAG TPA: exodeoxyribonuclease VII large subunit [Caulobacteraceae bacterium]|nr:exodeoxyribonuclease VII large subunit [Caulobacteraceae bacterium]
MSLADSAAAPEGNAKAYSVSELAGALKRTLEDAYGFVRLRGEVSKVTRHASGHVYLTLKDERACIDAVVWKGQVRGLKAQPEHGLEVVVTGRITTYPASSKYQIVIETMEHAGVGALLAQLERLKAKLNGEGLFDAARKRPLPRTPAVVGVITSPTGAVIRDVLHRIRDRWPCRVVVWPVVVQGEAAAAQVAAAVRGFDALAEGGPVPRPDVLIVARGGGSVEDLWPFNDEALARAVADCRIPVVSAVGHETDTTLIDFVSDRRAPTPTGAAEMVTPVLSELKAAVADLDRRVARSAARGFEERRQRLNAAARGLPRPADMLALASQRFDLVAGRLDAALARNTGVHERELLAVAARLTPGLLDRPRAHKAERLAGLGARLHAAAVRAPERAARDARLVPLLRRAGDALERRLAQEARRLTAADQLLSALNPDAPLWRGFARVHRADGALVRSAGALAEGEAVLLKFGDGERGAVVDGAPQKPQPPRPAPKRAPDGRQGDLF